MSSKVCPFSLFMFVATSAAYAVHARCKDDGAEKMVCDKEAPDTCGGDQTKGDGVGEASGANAGSVAAGDDSDWVVLHWISSIAFMPICGSDVPVCGAFRAWRFGCIHPLLLEDAKRARWRLHSTHASRDCRLECELASAVEPGLLLRQVDLNPRVRWIHRSDDGLVDLDS